MHLFNMSSYYCSVHAQLDYQCLVLPTRDSNQNFYWRSVDSTIGDLDLFDSTTSLAHSHMQIKNVLQGPTYITQYYTTNAWCTINWNYKALQSLKETMNNKHTSLMQMIKIVTFSLIMLRVSRWCNVSLTQNEHSNNWECSLTKFSWHVSLTKSENGLQLLYDAKTMHSVV